MEPPRRIFRTSAIRKFDAPGATSTPSGGAHGGVHPSVHPSGGVQPSGGVHPNGGGNGRHNDDRLPATGVSVEAGRLLLIVSGAGFGCIRQHGQTDGGNYGPAQ